MIINFNGQVARATLEFTLTMTLNLHSTFLLENVQRRFTKRINGFSCLSYEDRLIYLMLVSLRVRPIKQDMIMC